ncbi:unnamed protein product [Mytilus edulis]|uniref:B box-type domain-containing protein n=1 Tax=Mytilus edulis TaxID=6550 RepID=A0A8S3V164_MYTED|nr:unnamed protein product [Mytilus edulis]
MSQTILEGVRASHISLFGGYIYGTIFRENKVCCYKSTGELLWTFQHQDIDRPQGIALDKNGFVYIASKENNRIVVVSPDGKTCKTILSDVDGINYPVYIDIHRETGIMIVSSKVKKTSAEKDSDQKVSMKKQHNFRLRSERKIVIDPINSFSRGPANQNIWEIKRQNMASSDRDNCTLCYDEDGTSAEAVIWCTECEVFLCTDCDKHHKKSKTSKDHKTMSTKELHKLPKFMLEISSQCRDHKKKFELYCSFHDCPCCVTCITDEHKKCQDLKPLSDILKHIKSSASIQLLEKDLKNVKENLEEIIKYLNDRIDICKSQKTEAAEQIRSMRKFLDDLLNKLEQEILDDLESMQSQLTSKMNTLIQQLKTEAEQIIKLQSEFSKMTQYATELQMYVGLREIEKTTSQAAKYIDTLKSGDNLEGKELRCNYSICPAINFTRCQIVW